MTLKPRKNGLNIRWEPMLRSFDTQHLLNISFVLEMLKPFDTARSQHDPANVETVWSKSHVRMVIRVSFEKLDL